MKNVRNILALATLLGLVALTGCEEEGGSNNDVEYDGEEKVSAIRNLVVGGETYDVLFQTREPVNVYGAYPGTFSFTTETEAREAVDAVNVVLNDAGALWVGEPGGTELDVYFIGYTSFESSGGVKFCRYEAGNFDPPWGGGFSDQTFYITDPRMWAVFEKQ